MIIKNKKGPGLFYINGRALISSAALFFCKMGHRGLQLNSSFGIYFCLYEMKMEDSELSLQLAQITSHPLSQR